MTNPHGSFIWYELLTSDPDAAGKFYADVVGWSVGSFGGETPEGMDYRILSAGAEGIAGLMAIPAEAAQHGLRPGWLGYIGVDDVDAAVASVVAGGGTVRMPAFDLPGVGRMALVADPQGIAFYVMRGESDQPSRSFDAGPDAVGHCGWNELATPDLAVALKFYPAQFGWTLGDTMSMGDMGDYRFLHHGGEMIGAAMTHMPGAPAAWRFYFRVADIDAAAAKIGAGGGTILHGPVEVPGGTYTVIAADPQGAAFAVVGKRV